MRLTRDPIGTTVALCERADCHRAWLEQHAAEPPAELSLIEQGPKWCLYCVICAQNCWRPPACRLHDHLPCPPRRWILTRAAVVFYAELARACRNRPLPANAETRGERLCARGVGPARAARLVAFRS